MTRESGEDVDPNSLIPLRFRFDSLLHGEKVPSSTVNNLRLLHVVDPPELSRELPDELSERICLMIVGFSPGSPALTHNSSSDSDSSS